MWKLRMGALVTSGLLGMALTPGAWASGRGNSGDVWLDNIKPSTDPHLPCQDIVLSGSGLADSRGTFTLQGFSPSGSQELDYSESWRYTQTGARVIAIISLWKLIAQSEAGGNAGAQGFHFKLVVSQDPQTHKTFWVDCPGGDSTPGGSPSTGSVSSPAVTRSSGGPVITSIGAVTASRPRHPITHKHHRLVHPARHRKVRRRHVKAVRVAALPFTG